MPISSTNSKMQNKRINIYKVSSTFAENDQGIHKKLGCKNLKRQTKRIYGKVITSEVL